MNKNGFEFSFAWLFALIVGAVVIFIAIYATSQLIETERFASDTETGKQLGIILNPLESGIEDGKSAIIELNGPTRVFNSCKTSGTFGRQGISVAVRSGLGEAWGKPGVENAFFNKYIFSGNILEGEKIKVFSKPFKFPYKVADIVYMWNEEYCFVNAPDYIEEEIMDLQLKINSTNTISNCPENFIRVCFNSQSPECDIFVSTTGKYVEKESVRMYYDNDASPLVYGAIFADPGLYDCQVKRLLKRDSELALLYLEKASVLEPKQCSFASIKGNLISFSELTANTEPGEIQSLVFLSERIEGGNNDLICKLF
jgi:hypothetical protein